MATYFLPWLGSSWPATAVCWLFFQAAVSFRFIRNGVSSCLTMNNAWRIMDQKENAASMKEPV